MLNINRAQIPPGIRASQATPRLKFLYNPRTVWRASGRRLELVDKYCRGGRSHLQELWSERRQRWDDTLIFVNKPMQFGSLAKLAKPFLSLASPNLLSILF